MLVLKCDVERRFGDQHILYLLRAGNELRTHSSFTFIELKARLWQQVQKQWPLQPGPWQHFDSLTDRTHSN